MWTVLNAENLDACMDPAEEKSAALAGSSDALATTELTEKGKMKLPNLAFDGAFLSLKLSMNLLESYFIFQGVFSFLGVTISIDVSIKPGKEEDGGGINMVFVFTWRAGPVLIGVISGYMSIAPLDLEALTSGDFSALLNVKFMIGVSIKPNFLNVIMMVVEFAIKIVLKIILYLLLTLIQIAQIALEVAMAVVEVAGSYIPSLFQLNLSRFVPETAQVITRKYWQLSCCLTGSWAKAWCLLIVCHANESSLSIIISHLNSVSGLVSKMWYRIPFDQSDLSISKIPPTDCRKSDRVAILE